MAERASVAGEAETLETTFTDTVISDDDFDDYEVLYTGTTKEDLERKIEESGEFIEDWDGNKLWFTPRLHDHPHSAVYYAGKALEGGQNRDWNGAETPIMVEWEIPEDQIYLAEETYSPDDAELVHLGSPEEYWAWSVPEDWMNGYYEPNGGKRMKDGYELDFEGWSFEERLDTTI